MRIVPGPHDAKMLADTRKNPNALSKFQSNGVSSEENGDNGAASLQSQMIAQIAQISDIIRTEQKEDKLALMQMIRHEQEEQKILFKEFSIIILVGATLAVMTLVKLKRS